MIWKIITLGIFASVFKYYTDYRTAKFQAKWRAWLDWDRTIIYKNHPGRCRLILEDGGCEDVTHIGNGLILASCRFSWELTPGSIMAIDLNVADEAYDMKIINAPDRDEFLGGPHGISAWKEPETGKHFLYVLTHPPTKDKIEVFEVLNSTELKYIKTITDTAFDLMNDLVVVGKDQFYITYYGRTIYMAEFGEKTLHGFHRETGHSLTKLWEQDMGTGVDNIEVDPNNGDLWIGCHPLMWKITDQYNIMHSVAPSQVLRVKMRENNIDVIEEIFADDGSEMMLSTVATYVKGKLVIGSFATQTMICDVNYLS